jgi:dihydrofolate reductase
MGNTGGLLLGRRTYEDFHGFWPNQTDNPFTEVLDNSLKYVASRTLKQPLAWQNAVLLKGDAGEAVARLREQPGKDLVILGSGELVNALMRRNLIDECILLIHPLVLGSGRRLFPGCGDDRHAATRRLEDDRLGGADRDLPAGRSDDGEARLRAAARAIRASSGAQKVCDARPSRCGRPDVS